MAERAEERARAVEMAAEYLNSAASAGMREELGIEATVPLEPHLLGMGEHNINLWFEAPDDSHAGGLQSDLQPGAQRYVLRINVATQPFHKNQILYEYGALQGAEPSGCTPTPLYLDYSADTPGKGILVESFCEGRQLDFDDLRPGDVNCSIQMMADVHAVPVGSDSTLHRPADPLHEMLDEAERRFADYLSSGYEEARLTRWTELFLSATRAELDRLAPPQDATHIINTETLPSHFLIPAAAAERAAQTPATGRLVSGPGHFVDWERPVIGEVAQDVAYFVAPTTTFWDSDFLFPAADIPSVIERYWQAVNGRFERADFDERFRAWRMMTALKSTTWCIQAISRYTQDTGAHTTEKTAGKLPTYLSEEFMELIARECFYL